MRYVIALVLAGCAVPHAPLSSTSPANPAAPSGRLAGAPATLRSGVVDYNLAPVREAPAEHHHHH